MQGSISRLSAPSIFRTKNSQGHVKNENRISVRSSELNHHQVSSSHFQKQNETVYQLDKTLNLRGLPQECLV